MAAQVKLYGQTIGYVEWDVKRKIAIFEREEKCSLPFSPLDRLTMIEGLKGKTYQGLPSFLADCLPDAWGNRVIDLWLREKKIKKSKFSPVDKLCYIGNRSMGALEFYPEINSAGNNTEDVSIDSLIEVAQIALNSHSEFQGNLNNISESVQASSSAGGARAKAVVGINWSTKDICSGVGNLPNGYEHYLLKLDGIESDQYETHRSYCLNEYAYYKMAIDAGITISECSLLVDGEKQHFCTKRFDRLPGGKKLHTLTACGIFKMDFNEQQVYSYEGILGHMRSLKFPQSDKDEFFRRAVFNVFACNHDDHTKNFGFTMNEEGIWRLAPAYDVTFIHTDQWNNGHQITINDQWENLSREDIDALAKAADFSGSVDDELSKISSICKRFPDYASEVNLPVLRTKRIVDLLEDIRKGIAY